MPKPSPPPLPCAPCSPRRRARCGRIVPGRAVDAPAPHAAATDDSPPLRLDDRALHLPAHRRRAAATAACRSPRPALRRPPRSRRATGAALASKTVYDVHVIVRSALADATRRQLVDVNVALLAQAPRPDPGRAADPRPGPPSSCEPSSTVHTTCGSTRRCTSPP